MALAKLDWGQYGVSGKWLRQGRCGYDATSSRAVPVRFSLVERRGEFCSEVNGGCYQEDILLAR